MTDYSALDALERRAAEDEAFFSAERQADKYMKEHGTDDLVKQLRQARADRRRARLGTINVLVLLAHIDKLEEAIVKPPLVKP